MSETGEGLGYVPADVKQAAAEGVGGVDISGERVGAEAPPPEVQIEGAELTVLYEDERGNGEDGDLQAEAMPIEGGGEEEEPSLPEEMETFSATPVGREALIRDLSFQKQIFRLSEQVLDLIEESLAGDKNLEEMGETLASLEQELEALAEEIELLGSRLSGRVKSHFVSIRLMFHRLKRVHAVASGRETGAFVKADEEFEQSLLIALEDQGGSSPAGGGARRLVMAKVHDRRAAISEVRQWGSNISS
jgi:hypothetical protein